MARRLAAPARSTLFVISSLALLVACSGAEEDAPELGTSGTAGSGAQAGTLATGGSAGSNVTGNGGLESADAGRPPFGGAPSGGSAGEPSATGGTPSTAGRGGGAGSGAGAPSAGAGNGNAGAASGGSGGMTPGLEACPAPPDGTPDAAIVAINTENTVRLAMGLDCAAIALPLCTSAQNHCDYYTQNQGTECEAASAHDEIEGCPGYTGEGLGERFDAAGYMGRGGSECMAFTDDPERAVMMFIDSVYHRTPMLDPWMRDFGYGGSENCDTIDFGTGTTTPETVTALYPYADQTGVPTSFDGSREGPEPPEPSSGWPSGYPVTIYARDFTVTSHSITLDGSSEELAHQWLAEDDPTLPSYAKVLYTDAPMTAETTYHVVVSGELDGAPKTFDWKFTTGAATGGGRPRP